jgi:DNA-binding transcriptional MocR family regulator
MPRAADVQQIQMVHTTYATVANARGSGNTGEMPSARATSADHGARYRRIAAHVTAQISSGALRTGARLPSVRALSQQFEVSTNTVLHALATVEAEGLVEARPQSGYYVRLRATSSLALPAAPSPTPRAVALGDRDHLASFVRAMGDQATVPLGAACPSSELLPAAKLASLVGRVARMEGAKALRYDPLPGYPLLRREIARRMNRFGCRVEADRVVTTIGAIEALHLALKATTRRGDTVLVEAPCYFGILNLIEALELKVLEVPSDATTGLDLEAAERALGSGRVKACVVVPTFSNPLGSLMPVARKRALVALCASHQVALIESDVYGDLPFEGERPLPLKAFDDRGEVLYCSSFSKTVAPSFRVGWIAPGRHFDAVVRAKFTHTVASPTVTQAALAELLVSGGYDRHLRGLRRAMKQQVAGAREAIARSFPAGTRVSDPRGGFLLWVELPERAVLAGELQQRALRSGISIAPGPLFSAHRRFERSLRLSGGYRWSEMFDRAIATLGALCVA